MNDLVFLICCSAALIGVSVLVLVSLLRKKKASFAVRDVLITSVLVVFVLILPQYLSKYPPVSSLVFSLLYAVKSIGCGQSWEVCRWIVPSHLAVRILYYGLLYLDFLVIPILTLGFLASLFSNLKDGLRLQLLKRSKKNLFVFSALNPSAVSLASALRPGSADRIVFCDFREKEQKGSEEAKLVRQLGSIFTQRSAATLTFGKAAASVTYYLLSENKDDNLNAALCLLEHYNRPESKACPVELNLFAVGHVAEAIIDSAEKGNVHVKMIDEVKYACYELLEKTPLYLGVKRRAVFCEEPPADRGQSETEQDTLSVLILGAGSTGVEMIKAVSWCGQMDRVALEIHVIDKKRSIRDEFELLCPELTKENGYQIHFHDCDVTSKALYTVLEEHCMETGYIIVCLSNDDLNIETGARLREFYLRVRAACREAADCAGATLPVISVRVRDEQKSKTIDTLAFQKTPYHLNHFGTVSEVYNALSLGTSPIHLLSKYVHVAYRLAPDQALGALSAAALEGYAADFCGSPYAQRSSLAFALHIRYKLFGLLKEPFSFETMDEAGLQKIRELVAEHSEALARLEHRRWNAYLRSEGFRCCGKEEVAAYLDLSGQKHRFEIGKLHPCLVPWEQLDDVCDALRTVSAAAVPKSYQAIDRAICRSMPDMLERLYKER